MKQRGHQGQRADVQPPEWASAWVPFEGLRVGSLSGNLWKNPNNTVATF